MRPASKVASHDDCQSNFGRRSLSYKGKDRERQLRRTNARQTTRQKVVAKKFVGAGYVSREDTEGSRGRPIGDGRSNATDALLPVLSPALESRDC